MNITFRQLREHLLELTDEALDCDVAVFDSTNNEGHSGLGVGFAGQIALVSESGELEIDESITEHTDGLWDEGHPFIII